MSIPPVTSRAALSELERQRTGLALRREASPTATLSTGTRADGGDVPPGGDDEETGGKGAGRKSDVQRDPADQRGSADPKDGEGRKAP